MSHNLEQATDGTAAAFFADAPAWHGLGEVVEGAQTALDAGRLAHLNGWDIRTVPLYASDPENTKAKGLAARTIIVPDRFVGNLRTNPFTGQPEILGVVGSRYEIVQNEDAFAIADSIIEESGGANFETAGSLNDGRQVFMSIKLTGRDLLVGGEDAHDLYLVIWNSHDGSTAMYAMVTPVRVVCQNTLNAAIRQAKRRFVLRHTRNVMQRIDEARKALELTWKYAETFKAEAERMLATPFSEADFKAYTEALVPDPKSDAEGWIRRAQGARSAMTDLFLHAETTEFGRGTAWAAYNAASQYADWVRPSKKRDVLALGADTDRFKDQAFDLLVAA